MTISWIIIAFGPSRTFANRFESFSVVMGSFRTSTGLYGIVKGFYERVKKLFGSLWDG